MRVIIAERPWFRVESLEEVRNLLAMKQLEFPIIIFPSLSGSDGDIDGGKMHFVSDESSLEEEFPKCWTESPVGRVCCHC